MPSSAPRPRPGLLGRAVALLAAALLLVSLGVQPAAAMDHEPPELVEFDFTPKSVDVTDAPQVVTVTARITDETGAHGPSLYVRSSTTSWIELGMGPMTQISGTPQDGIYQRNVTVPSSTQSGNWDIVMLSLSDDEGNMRPGVTHPDKLRVINQNALLLPSAPPVIVAVAGNGAATVAWAAPEEDGGTPITGYRVNVEPDVKTVTVKGTTATISGLRNGSSYWFTVQAINAVGTGPKSWMSEMVTPKAPTPPTVKPTTPTPKPTSSPGPKPTSPATLDVYLTPGQHTVNGRQWRTRCEAYSETERCRTEIWATQVTDVGGKFVQNNGWVFNNLTYAPAPRDLWRYNPLAAHAEIGGKEAWVSADGRKWRTECDTAVTGRNGCRSYIEATVVETYTTPSGATGYRWVTKWILNNMVRFR